MKYTEKCGQPGCDFQYTGDQQAVARRVVGNHKRRVHNIIGASASAQWKAKNEGSVGKSQPEASAGPAKQRKVKSQHVASYCPECGCHLRAVNAAINLGRVA